MSSAVGPAVTRLETASVETLDALDLEAERDVGRTEIAAGLLEDAAPDAASESNEERSPKARLTVRCLLPDGSPWTEGGVELFARERPIEHWVWTEGRPRRGMLDASDARGHRVRWETDENGRAVFEAVVVGLEFQVRATDALGCAGASLAPAPMAEGEARELELWLARVPQPLRGRCVDEEGRPLPGATVDVQDAHAQPLAVTYFQRRTTDEAGEFDTPPLFAAHVNVRATLEDRIFAERLDVPIGGAAIELVLRRGRQLVVELRDDGGQPFHDLALFVHEQAGESPLEVHWEPCEEGRLYTALPDRPLELRWGMPCAPESMAVDAGVERVLLPARRPGSLAIEVGPLPGDTDTKYEAGLYCLDGTTPAWPPKTVLNTGHQQVQWTLAPGRYVLQLLHLPEHSPEAWAPWGAPVEVEVRSGETTFERMGGPSNPPGARD